jgi:hypothetical protein
MGRDGGFDLGWIDVGAAAQHHIGEAIAQIKITVGIESANIAERLPAIRAALRLGAEIVIGTAGAVIGQEEYLAALTGATSLPSASRMRSLQVSSILPTEPLCCSHSTPDMTQRPCRSVPP